MEHRHLHARLSLSVVIPARNEARVLPGLLNALDAQTLRPKETIVADAASVDRTPAIARGYGCKVVSGGLPAVGRNAGARAASGDLVVFLDSDVTIGPEFLEGLERQVRTRRLDAGTVYNVPRYAPGDKGYHALAIRLFDGLVYFVHNVGLGLSALVRYPYATGTCMFMRREVFRRSGGFDVRLAAFEDAELAARIGRMGVWGVVKHPPVHISTRRFDRHNRLLWVLYLLARGFVGRAIVGEKTHGDYFDRGLIPRTDPARLSASAAMSHAPWHRSR
jgi:glycosyltransferase involved in cell wall biosynthesis